MAFAPRVRRSFRLDAYTKNMKGFFLNENSGVDVTVGKGIIVPRCKAVLRNVPCLSKNTVLSDMRFDVRNISG